MNQSYSLYELNEYIKRVLALNFAEPIWINAEISQIKESRGNVYIELVEQNDAGDVIAQISAAIWYKSFLFIRNKLGILTQSLLAPGVHVMIKVGVDYHERYGLKLLIEDIDPAYTMGKLELARQKIIDRLQAEGIFYQNKEIKVPTVIQRIAVISAENAAGYKDFSAQLEENSYGYEYAVTLFPAALQGQNTEREVCSALDLIFSKSEEFDAIAIIRGGGSKLDLAFFDNFNIGYKIATAPLPVITGIGHEIDQSIADMVACIPLKTPTAVADFILEKTLHFESSIHEMKEYIITEAKRVIKDEALKISNLASVIKYAPANKVYAASQDLSYLYKSLFIETRQVLKYAASTLDTFESWIKTQDPTFLLQKGYTLILQDGKYITESKSLQKSKFDIIFADSTITIDSKFTKS